jgi:flagellar protein FlgJ
MQVSAAQAAPAATPSVMAGRPNTAAGRTNTTAGTSIVTAGRATVVAGTSTAIAGRPTVTAGLDPAIYASTAATSGSPATAAPDISAAQLAKMHQAAQDFEAMALGQLLAPMFNTVDSAHSAFGGGEAEATIKPLLVDAIAKHIAAHGGLGLAPPVFASMLRTQEAANAAGQNGPHMAHASRPAHAK